jgi:hypothetical protein
LEITMQREFRTIDFTTQAEVRAQAESRRTEEVAALLKALFAWWTPRLRQWTLRQWTPGPRRSRRPIFGGVGFSHRPVTAGK